jgi:uncharacterized membrane protein YedE/YeeE
MNPHPHWKTYFVLSVLFLLAVTAAAGVTRLWVLTAIPIGFLFGFFLQKGNLCGASAFSLVLLARDWRTIGGLWVCIVVSMAGFALLDLLGLVTLNVKPMMWLNAVVGGALFGAGMVLAGGCVSGCLYKAATGNLNAVVALTAMPFGMAMVQYGPLNGLFRKMKTVVTHAPDGGPLGLPAVTGLPYWVLALVFAAGTVLVMFLRKRKEETKEAAPGHGGPVLERLLTRPWKPWKAGLAIGILASFAYLSSAASGRNYPLGVSHGVLFTQQLITETGAVQVYRKAPAAPVPAPPSAAPAPSKSARKIVWWLVLLVGFLMVGSFVSARLSGQARLLPKPPEQILVAILGGFLAGTGAALGMGCVIGNILSGWALMSLGRFSSAW